MDRGLGALFRLGRGEGGWLGKPPEQWPRWGLLFGVMSHIFFIVKCHTARIFTAIYEIIVECYNRF